MTFAEAEIKDLRAEIARLTALFKRECDLVVDIRAEAERLTADYETQMRKTDTAERERDEARAALQDCQARAELRYRVDEQSTKQEVKP